MTGRLIPPGKAAEILDVSPWTLVRWSKKGYLTEITTPGGHHRYDEDEVLAWIQVAAGDLTPPRVPEPPGRFDPPLDVTAILDAPTVMHCPTCTCDQENP